ncbi:hypothetical protein D1AOALGA4SA_7792 [Olavius algarvensis Delta 1 endosymbiont]|nr:hypothetical protein D1AOALGA4SA_7792 [Olavius algarvensis Delta 1 endosymbiont]
MGVRFQVSGFSPAASIITADQIKIETLKKRITNGATFFLYSIEPAHKLKIDQNKLQNCRSNILNLVNVL